MNRAVVLIGVSKAGNLPQLQAVEKGLARMKEWAVGQGIPAANVITISDEAGTVEVTADRIKKVIDTLVQLDNLDQLIIYFAGHGVNNGMSEYWLLTDAPIDPDAAVNVKGSSDLARYCGVSHVVLISDACRTAAGGIQMQVVNGAHIFRNPPNTERPASSNAVDQFYACALGNPAFEVRDPNDAAAGYHAVYTETLADALGGKLADLLMHVVEEGEGIGYVRPQPLKRKLFEEVPRRFAAAAGLGTAPPAPDALILSDETAWLSRIRPEQIRFEHSAPSDAGEGAMFADGKDSEEWVTLNESYDWSEAEDSVVEALPEGHTDDEPAGEDVPVPESELPPGPTIAEAARELLDALLEPGSTALPDLSSAGSPSEREMFRGTHARAGETFGPLHYETGCGFKVRGARVAKAVSRSVRCELLGEEGDLVRVYPANAPVANVLLVLEDGSGVLLPAIRDFIGALTFDEGELENVSYEPSEFSWRFDAMRWGAAALRELRAIAAAATRLGVFRLEGENAKALARRMQMQKSIDPTLAIYAAYAYYSLGQRAWLRDMAGYQWGNLQASLFDVTMLAGMLQDGPVLPGQGVFPPFPMLTQGWALLGANNIEMPPLMRGIERHLRQSVWTMFDSEGVAMIRRAIENGEVA